MELKLQKDNCIFYFHCVNTYIMKKTHFCLILSVMIKFKSNKVTDLHHIRFLTKIN